MLNFFKKKCPVCKMELKEKEGYIEGFSKKFCSDECRETFRKKLAQEQSKTVDKGYCH